MASCEKISSDPLLVEITWHIHLQPGEFGSQKKKPLRAWEKGHRSVRAFSGVRLYSFRSTSRLTKMSTSLPTTPSL